MKNPFTSGGACLAFLLTFFPFLLAQNVETKESVRLVHNVKGGTWGAVPKLDLKLVRKLGDVDSDNENLAFSSPGDIVEDGDRNLYVVDSGNYRILKFNKGGDFIISFGRKGQGPGEFSSIRSLSIDLMGRLHVLDDTQRRIQIFSTEGRALQSIRLLKGNIDCFRSMEGDLYVVHESVPGRQVVEQKTLLKIIDAKESVKSEFCAPQDYGESVTNQVGNSFHFAVGRDGSIIVSFAFQNRIEKYSHQGKLVWKADRPLNFETKVLEKGKYEASANMTRYTSPKMNSCSRGVAVDDTGRSWVLTYRRQIKPEEVIGVSRSFSAAGVTIKRTGNTDLRATDMYQLEVFDREGILLGAIPLSHFVDGIWIFQDRLYLLDRERGVTYYQYRIVER